ncbi:phosphoribosylamine--glycine ligase [Thermospira aquatica]|uniref:Phosphoribosylamine--glycine ligase n=1 Tax=Thermospira aquatica TaxID=2828656 RepID=A0AAX3BCJ3_9SPIR|nr:phosphoribosylamine--glycine ligase [Thermospira aquatica]URA09995.1 phosphoribosylamine--glycine ligase [Thermospira aquatica]
MRVLLLGGGGREAAMAWSITRSSRLSKLYICPGNGGTHQYGTNVEIPLEPPFEMLVKFIQQEKIEMVIVGPEAPLVAGVVDELRKHKIKVFGPKKAAARLEGSKVFMKEFLARHGIPTAYFQVFSRPEDAYRYVEKQNRAFVVKTDGLAAGKGVTVARTKDETMDAIRRMMVDREFGDAGNRIILEDRLDGVEVSVFVVSDGKHFHWLASAQDHKRLLDNDEGPNTGGMGAYAPVPFLDQKMKEIITLNIIEPTIMGLKKEGYPYTGVLYFGLMLTQYGPSVLEYNVRFGDPEAQVILPLMKTSFLDLACATVEEKLHEFQIDFYPGYCVTVVLASEGYPGAYKKGVPIKGDLSTEVDCLVFHAGTKLVAPGQWVTSGGRVLCVTAISSTLSRAIDRAYEKVAKISFDGMQYRKDIGKKGIVMR